MFEKLTGITAKVEEKIEKKPLKATATKQEKKEQEELISKDDEEL